MSIHNEKILEAKPSESGPYVLRTLLNDVPLSADGADNGIKINCVEYFGTHPTTTVTWTEKLTPCIQTAISTLEPVHPNYFTMSIFPKTHARRPGSRYLCLPLGSGSHSPNPTIRGLEYNGFSSFLGCQRRVYYATGLSPSTPCPSSVLSSEPNK